MSSDEFRMSSDEFRAHVRTVSDDTLVFYLQLAMKDVHTKTNSRERADAVVQSLTVRRELQRRMYEGTRLTLRGKFAIGALWVGTTLLVGWHLPIGWWL